MLSILSLIQMITGKYRTVIVKYTHKTWNMDVFYHMFKIFQGWASVLLKRTFRLLHSFPFF